MPKDAESSSSSEEDWTAFESAAVSVAQLDADRLALSNQQRNADEKRIARARKVKPAKAHTAAQDGGAEPRGGGAEEEGDDGSDSGPGETLDVVQLKIAALLERRLDKSLGRVLDSVPPSLLQPEGKRKKKDRIKEQEGEEEEREEEGKKKRKKKKHSATGEGSSQATGAGGTGSTPGMVEDVGCIRLFKKVKVGTPCVVRSHPGDDSQPCPADEVRVRHPAKGALPRRRRPARPSLEELASLVVDGAALIQRCSKTLRPRKGGRLPLHGVVLEGRPYVPYEHRALVLVGR